MGRFDHEKNAQSWWGSSGKVKPQKIGSPKKSKRNLCPKCHCDPCKQRFECRKRAEASGKQKGCLGCAVFAGFLVSGLGGAVYAFVEMVWG